MTKENRGYIRIKKNLPLKIKFSKEDSDFVIETHDISCSGAMCTADKYIPPMTKVALTFLLPQHGHSPATKIQCSAVVVRINENPDNKNYDIGMFFSDIKDSEKSKLETYINNYL